MTNNPISIWAKELNGHFTKEDKEMANKYMKRFSTSLVTKEMQIRAIMRYYHTPIRMVQKTQH